MYEYELKRINKINLRNHLVWANIVIVVTILGILVVLLGVVFLMLGFTSIAIVQVAGGAITAVFPKLVYRPADEARQTINNMSEHLFEIRNFNMSIETAEKIEDPERRDRVFQDLIIAFNMRKQWSGSEIPALSMRRQSNDTTLKSTT